MLHVEWDIESCVYFFSDWFSVSIDAIKVDQRSTKDSITVLQIQLQVPILHYLTGIIKWAKSGNHRQ